MSWELGTVERIASEASVMHVRTETGLHPILGTASLDVGAKVWIRRVPTGLAAPHDQRWEVERAVWEKR